MPWNGWWWHMGWMWIFWIAVIVLIVWAVRGPLTTNRSRDESALSADEILKRRYARGEIGKEEYDRKLEDLRK
jgi:putative membrane protein